MYGGAMWMAVPERLLDVSPFRQVPDHQEIYADAKADQSVVVELNEQAAVADEACGDLYWEDQADANGAIEHTHGTAVPVVCPRIARAYTAFTLEGTQQVAKFRDTEPNTLHLGLLVVRLPEMVTDVVVVVNTPLTAVGSSAGCQPQTAASTRELLQRAVETIEVVNWGLSC